MAQGDIEINVEATGVSAYERDMKRASRATSNATGLMSSALKKMSAAAAGAFSVRAVWDFTKDSVAAFATFEQAAQDLSAITGATGKDLEFFKNQAEQLGIGVEGGAAATLKAFELIGSAKPELLASKEALASVTKEAIALSQASGMSLPDAASSAVSALNQYGAAADQAGKFVNVLAAGALEGSSTIANSTQALESFGSIAAGANVSIEESIGLIQTLATKSIMGAEAGTVLRTMLLKMSNAEILSPNALADMERLGINAAIVADTTLPLEKRLREVGKAMNDTGALTHIFEEANVNAAKTILGNIGVYTELTKKVTGTEAAYKQAEIRNATLMHSFTELQNRIGGVMMEFGESLKPVIDDIINGFEPAFKSVKAAFIEIYTPMADAISAFGSIFKAFGMASEGGSQFANIVGTVVKVLKFVTIPAQLAWKWIGFVARAFGSAVSGIKDFVSNSPILMGAVDVLIAPFRMLGDAIGWVGDKLGIGGGGTITAMEQYTATMKYAGEEVLKLGQANGLTIPEIQGFTKQIDLSRYAGLSQAEATVRMAGDMRNYALVARATAAATGGVTDSVDKLSGAMAKAAGPAAGSIDALNAKLSELKKAFTATSSDAQRAGLKLQIAELERQIKRMSGDLDPANKGLSSMTKRFSDIAMAAGSAKNELADVMAASEAAGQPDFSSGLAIAQKRLEDRAEAIKDIFKSLSDGIKSMAIDMGYTISEAIGYAITAGGGFGDAIKAVLREMAVQIPKMAGMALLNAATFPGNSAIALPLTIAGAALLGLSGILSGVFKGADAKKQQEQQSIANNSGASSVPRAAQSGLAAFVDNQQNVGQQVVDALNGTQLTLQVGEKSMDAYVKGANKRNATREGK